MSDAMTRALAQPPVPVKAPRKRAARPSPSVNPTKSSKEQPVTADRTLDLPPLSAEELAGPLGRTVPAFADAREAALAEAVASAQPASAPQQDVLSGVPGITASNGYTKTRLGTLVLVGNVGASKQILAKRVAGRDLVEFSFAARTLGHTEPTWYRCTLWEGAEETLDLIRQGTYLQLKGQAVQSQSHRTGRVFLDVTVQRLAEGPVKGQQLSVAGTVPTAPKGYFRRLWDALRGR